MPRDLWHYERVLRQRNVDAAVRRSARESRKLIDHMDNLLYDCERIAERMRNIVEKMDD